MWDEISKDMLLALFIYLFVFRILFFVVFSI